MSVKKLSYFLVDRLVLEGGLAGHMSHPFDYTDFTGKDLIGLVEDIFTGKIEHMKEKLDGTNVNAYRNLDGDVRFIRNQTDLNRPDGGMSIEEMSVKWADKPSVAKVFTEAGTVIEKVFSRVPVKFFNPDPDTKVVVNCECITAGKTNVMVYVSDRVAFHGTSTYIKTDTGWKIQSTSEGIPSEIEKASEGIAGTEQRPDLIVKSVEEGNRLAEKFSKDIEKLFKDQGLSTSATIDEWKSSRFVNMCPDWLDPADVYGRWFSNDKTIGLNQLKKKYPDHISELKELDQKQSKDIVRKVLEPLDELFMRIGNALISLLDGFTNRGRWDEVAGILRTDLESLVSSTRQNGTQDEIDKLDVNLYRLERIGDTINATEGVVFTYKGRLMKLTGSFAALNQIMGIGKFSR